VDECYGEWLAKSSKKEVRKMLAWKLALPQF